MGRPAGSRNRDYEQTRRDLALRLSQHLVRDGGEPATLADLAQAAGVSATTLKHYFGDRNGIFTAVMESVRADGAIYLEQARRPAGRSPERSVTDLLLGTIEAWRRYGLGRLFASSLALSLGNGDRGPAFLSGLLEPLLDGTEQLIGAHVADGRLPVCSERAVALSLVSPVVMALLHQDNLGGAGTRPLDVEEFASTHAHLILGGLTGTPRAVPSSGGDD
ncbi:TetR/AcrR family transcriptional regulator [Nocardioides rubriscoriae]|uniref:TetR/AcrR family transcriptional regulator n=1 Tax=Nocardioides rubriscoriae TaxID=642762 RepID=UPI0011DFFE01|nr:TetR/AcrR family transcriptional regulator [Nocardioides rubriscoriae]